MAETPEQTLEKLLASGTGVMASVVTGEGGTKRLLLSLPVNNPPLLSKSQKTLLVASTKGAQVCEHVQVNQQGLIINVNAYIYAKETVRAIKEKAEKKAEKDRAKLAKETKKAMAEEE